MMLWYVLCLSVTSVRRTVRVQRMENLKNQPKALCAVLCAAAPQLASWGYQARQRWCWTSTMC